MICGKNISGPDGLSFGRQIFQRRSKSNDHFISLIQFYNPVSNHDDMARSEGGERAYFRPTISCLKSSIIH
ncbi:hypothetical protein V2J09_021595 [Rumex salicifolius]